MQDEELRRNINMLRNEYEEFINNCEARKIFKPSMFLAVIAEATAELMLKAAPDLAQARYVYHQAWKHGVEIHIHRKNHERGD